MTDVNLDSYEQSCFVQDWLAAWSAKHLHDGDSDWQWWEAAIENIQETQPAKPEQPETFIAELRHEQRVFLQEIDGMIESTGEFIRDDNLTLERDTEGRFLDLAALNHVREMYGLWYDLEEAGRLDDVAETGDLLVLSRMQFTMVLSALGQIVEDPAGRYPHAVRQDAALLADRLGAQYRLAEEARHAEERRRAETKRTAQLWERDARP